MHIDSQPRTAGQGPHSAHALAVQSASADASVSSEAKTVGAAVFLLDCGGWSRCIAEQESAASQMKVAATKKVSRRCFIHLGSTDSAFQRIEFQAGENGKRQDPGS